MQGTIEIHKAIGHGFRFDADSLDDWNSETPEGCGWIFSATRVVEVSGRAPLEQTAQWIADAEFQAQNEDGVEACCWWQSRYVTLTDVTPDWALDYSRREIEVTKKRSLSVGDVLVVRAGEDCVVLGCDSCGWKVLDDES